MLTSDRAYACPCFYQSLASARLSAHSRYRASESEAGVVTNPVVQLQLFILRDVLHFEIGEVAQVFLNEIHRTYFLFKNHVLSGGNSSGMNPSFFEGKDFTRAHRALHFLKEMLVARSLLFLMEKIARRVAMPFCFCWKMASLYCISNGN